MLQQCITYTYYYYYYYYYSHKVPTLSTGGGGMA